MKFYYIINFVLICQIYLALSESSEGLHDDQIVKRQTYNRQRTYQRPPNDYTWDYGNNQRNPLQVARPNPEPYPQEWLPNDNRQHWMPWQGTNQQYWRQRPRSRRPLLLGNSGIPNEWRPTPITYQDYAAPNDYLRNAQPGPRRGTGQRRQKGGKKDQKKDGKKDKTNNKKDEKNEVKDVKKEEIKDQAKDEKKEDGKGKTEDENKENKDKNVDEQGIVKPADVIQNGTGPPPDAQIEPIKPNSSRSWSAPTYSSRQNSNYPQRNVKSNAPFTYNPPTRSNSPFPPPPVQRPPNPSVWRGGSSPWTPGYAGRSNPTTAQQKPLRPPSTFPPGGRPTGGALQSRSHKKEPQKSDVSDSSKQANNSKGSHASDDTVEGGENETESKRLGPKTRMRNSNLYPGGWLRLRGQRGPTQTNRHGYMQTPRNGRNQNPINSGQPFDPTTDLHVDDEYGNPIPPWDATLNGEYSSKRQGPEPPWDDENDNPSKGHTVPGKNVKSANRSSRVGDKNTSKQKPATGENAKPSNQSSPSSSKRQGPDPYPPWYDEYEEDNSTTQNPLSGKNKKSANLSSPVRDKNAREENPVPDKNAKSNSTKRQGPESQPAWNYDEEGYYAEESDDNARAFRIEDGNKTKPGGSNVTKAEKITTARKEENITKPSDKGGKKNETKEKNSARVGYLESSKGETKRPSNNQASSYPEYSSDTNGQPWERSGNAPSAYPDEEEYEGESWSRPGETGEGAGDTESEGAGYGGVNSGGGANSQGEKSTTRSGYLQGPGAMTGNNGGNVGIINAKPPTSMYNNANYGITNNNRGIRPQALRYNVPNNSPPALRYNVPNNSPPGNMPPTIWNGKR